MIEPNPAQSASFDTSGITPMDENLLGGGLENTPAAEDTASGQGSDTASYRTAGMFTDDHVAGATSDFLKNYQDMRDANTIGADKYFHCKANCEASQRGDIGRSTAEILSNTREWVDQNVQGDPPSASAADQAANLHGRQQGTTHPNASCSTLCSVYRPNGLDPKY